MISMITNNDTNMVVITANMTVRSSRDAGVVDVDSEVISEVVCNCRYPLNIKKNDVEQNKFSKIKFFH